MNKAVVVTTMIVIGALGFGVGRWSLQADRPAVLTTSGGNDSVAYEYQREPPSISQSEALDHRASNYAQLKKVDAVLELPSDFSQTEALYALAGRASQAELETLILESVDIINRYDRSAAIQILFSRYAELAPDDAVDFLVSMKLDIDDQVFGALFEAWTKADLNGAVAGANRLTNTRQRKRASHAILTTTSRYHQGLLDQVAADLKSSHALEYIRSEAIAIRANSDPQRAMQEALASENSQSRWSAVVRVARVWARQDPAAALQYSAGISNQNMRDQFVNQVLNRWVEDDPLQAMQYINAHPNEQERNQMLQSSLSIYAQSQPGDALLIAQGLSGNAKTMALQQVLGQWAQDDIDSAMGAINSLDNRIQRGNLISMVGQTLSQRDPTKALAWLDALDSDSRTNQLATVLPQLAHHDPRRALEYVMANMPDGTRSQTMTQVMRVAMMTDPVVAQDYLNQLPDSEQRHQLYEQLAGHVSRQGADATLQWIGTLSGSSKTHAIKGAAQALASGDPQASASLIAQLPEHAVADVLHSVSSNMGYRDPGSALVWLEQFNGRAGYDTALQGVIQTVARTDPQQALTLSMKLQGENRSSVTQMAVGRWSSTDPAGAAGWASRADPAVRSAAIQGVAQSWVQSDPVSAERWIVSLPDGEGKDQALIALAGTANDPGRLSGYIGSMSSDELRVQAITMAYAGLLRRQGEQSASDFLDRVGADVALRDQLSRQDWR